MSRVPSVTVLFLGGIKQIKNRFRWHHKLWKHLVLQIKKQKVQFKQKLLYIKIFVFYWFLLTVLYSFSLLQLTQKKNKKTKKQKRIYIRTNVEYQKCRIHQTIVSCLFKRALLKKFLTKRLDSSLKCTYAYPNLEVNHKIFFSINATKIQHTQKHWQNNENKNN